VLNGTEGISAEDREFLLNKKSEKPIVILWNKTDLVPLQKINAEHLPGQVLPVSAKTGEGVNELLHAISGLLEAASGASGVHGENNTGPGTIRQKDLIDSALAQIEEALGLADGNEPLDIIAPLFRSAVNSLGEITGEVFTDDILEAMFSRFCVGK
jgi:tRNA modification GTPase